MNRLFFVFAFLFSVAIVKAKNERKCDIGVDILTPVEGYTFRSPGLDSSIIVIRNLGPDTIIQVDNFAVTFSFAGFVYITKSGTFGKTLIPGDSLIYTGALKMIGTNPVDSIELCVKKIIAYSHPNFNGRKLIIEKEGGETFGNNSTCIIVNHAMFSGVTPLETDTEGFVIYPNPAFTEIKLSGTVQPKSYRILTVDGKTIKSSTTSNLKHISVVDLLAGYYLLEVTSENNLILYYKFLKQ
ncbi:MAG: hypothetical protein ACI8ZN_002612 [Bacteroidia bacterium]|jgi:hypothetical protein